MAGYLIAAIDIKDPEGFDDYRRQVSPIIARYGGRYIVRGGAVTPLEGTAPQRRLVVIEFPSVDAARQLLVPARTMRPSSSSASPAPRPTSSWLKGTKGS